MTVTTRPLAGWTQADIDAALIVIKAKLDAALAAGELSDAAHHEGWMNRLLDARPYHRASS